MTEEEIDAFAGRLALHATRIFGDDGAPGVLLQALLIASDNHGLDATVFALERTVIDLRAQLAASIKPEGTVQ